jgi:hypothetical protein
MEPNSSMNFFCKELGNRGVFKCEELGPKTDKSFHKKFNKNPWSPGGYFKFINEK